MVGLEDSQSVSTSQMSFSSVNPQLESKIKRERISPPDFNGLRSIPGIGTHTILARSRSNTGKWILEEVDPDVIPNRYGKWQERSSVIILIRTCLLILQYGKSDTVNLE